MFKTGFVLSTEAHLVAAMYNQSPVSVWMKHEIIDYGGVIEEIRNGCVRINGDWHPFFISDENVELRPCEFRIR